MNTLRALSCAVLASLMAFPSVAPQAMAEPYQLAQATDCHAVGMRYAAQAGGQLARATPEIRGGQQVCVIVVLLPARDGQRPRREEIVVPAG